MRLTARAHFHRKTGDMPSKPANPQQDMMASITGGVKLRKTRP